MSTFKGTKIYKKFKEEQTRKRVNYFLVFLLLFLSGNPAFYRQTWDKEGTIFVAVVLAISLKKYIDAKFIKAYLGFLSVFFVVFLIQYINLGSVSISFILGFILRVFTGGIIFYKLKDQFSPVFFNLMYYLCLISLPLYLLHYLIGEGVLGSIAIQTTPKSLLFYTLRVLHVNEGNLRNSGMFWEPGGYQGYINLCLFMNFHRLPYLLKFHRNKIYVIIITLLSTQSTTGYLVFGVLIGLYVLAYTNVNRGLAIMMTLVFVIAGAFVFNNVAFLGEKITQQYNLALETNGDFNNSRFSTVLFDLHYIYKNPLTGNGFDVKTRFADHPELIAMIENGENLGLGNGFIKFIASAGMISMFWYLFSIFKSVKKQSIIDAYSCILILVVLLQGEDLLRFPFFFGLPFFVPFIKNSRSHLIYLTKKKNRGNLYQV